MKQNEKQHKCKNNNYYFYQYLAQEPGLVFELISQVKLVMVWHYSRNAQSYL